MSIHRESLEKVANTSACSSVRDKADAIDKAVSVGYKPVIVLRDLKSRYWSAPVVYDSCNASLRQLRYAAQFGKDVNTGALPLFSQYPDDFELVLIGVFSTFNGELESFPTEYFIRFNVKEILSNE